MKTKYISGIVVAIVAISCVLFRYWSLESKVEDDSKIQVTAEPPKLLPVAEEYPNVIASGMTLSSALTKQDVSPSLIHLFVEAAKPVRDLTRILPGWRFQIVRDAANEVLAVRFRFSAVDFLDIENVAGQWIAKPISVPTETRIVTFEGKVSSSLWESAEEAKMDPNLIADLAEIFAFEVDFARAVRLGDSWKISVEEKLVRGEHYEWGAITQAEFVNAGTSHEGILFRRNGETLGYFAPDGSNLKKMFLKSPIRYGRISSRFNRARFHPVLQVHRPHLGVDYAAPIGTPIRAVGAGTIEVAGWNGGAGKMIRIRHNGTYETAYKHLSKFAPGIRRGSRVEQGQLIGYVGNTGLSTGPHLHYEFYIAGRFVDPLSAKFPSGEPVPQNLTAQFQALIEKLERNRDRVPAHVKASVGTVISGDNLKTSSDSL